MTQITVFACIAMISVLPQPARSDEILIDDYQVGLSPKWKEKKFKGKTVYEVVKEDGRLCVEARSRSTASGLFFEVAYDPKKYPILAWSWKIDRVLVHGDASKKAGDDFAARVYVIFPSWTFWKTKAICYMWANKLPQGKSVPNPYNNNTVMIAVQSGEKQARRWFHEKRNVFEDYQRCFGTEPPVARAVAIMTDTDNTGETATAWYGPIRLLSDSNE